MLLYSVFGLRIQSNIEIPGFPLLPDQAPADVTVMLGSLPAWLDRAIPPNRDAWYVSPEFGERGYPSSRVWRVENGDYFRILYDDGTDCLVSREGTRIWIWWPESYTVEDIVPYLQGQLLGFVQRLRGVTCFHASAVSIGDRALVITGPKGSGKSSTAAAFLRLGYPVLADDVVPVFEDAEGFMVHPAHPRLWLRPDMVEALYGSSDALPLLAPSWEKRYLDLNAGGPGLPPEPRPLAAIYMLSRRADEPDRPLIVQAEPRDTLLELLCNTYVNHLLDSEMRSREFAVLSRIQRSVPALHVRPHGDALRITSLCQAILADVADRLPSLR